MSNEHTPGPWYADPGRRVTGFAVTHEGEPNPLAISLRKPANSYSKGISDAKALANARLIAAAPDLLEQLEETHAALCFTPDYIGSARYNKNADAILKARGTA
ncbi:hypothetical protein [Stutzerimonas stutzeri]|uniref:Uncharacterized protein n=1 Tax=Stutzerimonas stutzeri TaxID=316 RepID=A0A172WRC4_STUST|nr:hypothetical protein [Stutzerimonas stutzeri]ANF26003.1 hypothetical protein PS273GM_13045 [Stutzerimonas stutzeri]